ncbi:G8 domain-containing protein, partial [Candidatus Laterigemmans baculatus]|uniref:G8 domain-containing protein n=1 Tax=Candidatus Laterigemmans baculatus TaxID=2770505 RepID=UPI0013DAAD54
HLEGMPNFVEHPTHVISESGRWSQIAALENVDANSVVVIAEGHSVIFDVEGVTLQALGVSGELRFAADVDTRLTVQELIVFDSGYLEVGTAEAPIARGVRAEIVIGDRPLDAVDDPAQYGNGIIVLGKIRLHGQSLESTFAALTASPRAGDTLLRVSAVPQGWRVGDVIAIPQT